MAFWPLVWHAVLYGLLLSAALFAVVLAITRFNPEIMLNDYPPDIRARFGPMSARARRQQLWVGLLTLALMIGLIVLSFSGLPAAFGGDLPFWAVLTHLLTLFTVFNLLDWLVLDWLIMVRLQPKFIVLPGTEGMAGYRDYAFHFRGFLIGVAITVPTAALVAALIAWLF